MSPGPVVVAMLSHRDPPLLRRLIQRIHEGSNTVALVHHDPRGIPHGLEPNDRTLLVQDTAHCDWGRMNLAHGFLRLLEETRRLVPDFSWLLLISGQDYPAQSLSRTESELAETEADAFIQWYPVMTDRRDNHHPWQVRCRNRYLHRIRIPGSRRSVPWHRSSPFRDDLRLYIADTWVNLNASAVDHALAQRARMAHVERYLYWCPNPAEALLPTLLLNDAEQLKIVTDHKRYIRWIEGKRNPEFLGPEDLPRLSTRGAFFARKLDSQRTPEMLDRLDELASQRLTRMKVLVFPHDSNPYQALLYAEAATLGAEVTYLGKLTPFGSVNLLLLPAELAVRRLTGAQIVHLHWLWGFLLPGAGRFRVLRRASLAWFHVCIILIRLLGLRLVWTAHNVLPHSPIFPDDIAARRFLVNQCDVVFGHSAWTLSSLAEIGAVPRRWTLIRHAPFQPTPATSGAKRSRAREAREFLFFGKIFDYKGVEDLLEAFAQVQESRQAHLTVAGECINPALRTRIQSYAGARVSLRLQFIPDSDIEPLMYDADVVVLPFRRITTSGSALLALSYGKPLVIPALSALADLPDDAVFRYDGSITGLAATLRSVTNTEEAVLLRMSSAALAYSAEATWNQAASTTVVEYRKALAEHVPDRHEAGIPITLVRPSTSAPSDSLGLLKHQNRVETPRLSHTVILTRILSCCFSLVLSNRREHIECATKLPCCSRALHRPLPSSDAIEHVKSLLQRRWHRRIRRYRRSCNRRDLEFLLATETLKAVTNLPQCAIGEQSEQCGVSYVPNEPGDRHLCGIPRPRYG